MTTYALVSDGTVTRLGLPSSGTLKDGRAVSNYSKLDDRTLAAEGWLPVVEDRPSFDPKRCRLEGPEYAVETSRVVARYTVKPLPAALVTDADSVLADGASVVVVTYTNYASTAPTSVTFDVNGAQATERLTDGLASVEVAAEAPGPITVTCEGLSLTITAEEVSA